jgi:REP element-mobilizing transposase RayT
VREVATGSAGVSPVPGCGGTGEPRTRHYLPHLDRPGVIQMITFRLADALPAEAIKRLTDDPLFRPEAARRRQLEHYLDAGYGSCHLSDPTIGHLIETALHHFNMVRYRLFAWVVMPNHVHVVVEPLAGHSLSRIVHSWKSFTAKQANRHLGLTGAFWQVDYFDRAVRDERHLAAAIEYIHDNPVKAGLARRPEDWPHSSARIDTSTGAEAPALRVSRQR